MTKDPIDQLIPHLVARFLNWKLPADFAPDAGISFTPDYNVGTPYPMRHEPTGTNLLNAEQAFAMVHHMLDHPAVHSLAATAQQPDVDVVERVKAAILTTAHLMVDVSNYGMSTNAEIDNIDEVARAALAAMGGKVEGQEKAYADLGRFAARYSHPERRQPHANVTAEELLSAIWHHPGNLARKSPATPAQEHKP